MQKVEEVFQRANTSLNLAIPVALISALFIGFSYREEWEPIKKLVAIATIALGLTGCATSGVSSVSLGHNETYRERVTVVSANETIRVPVERKLANEFDFSFVPYTHSHFAVVVTDSYAEGIVALHVRIRFAGIEIHHLDIEETIGDVDSATAEALVALLANDPSTLNSIVELVRDALVVADAKNKKYEQIAENR